MSAIKIINTKVPSVRSRHFNIQHFAIQEWKERGDIVMCHIPGGINPADDLTKSLSNGSCMPTMLVASWDIISRTEVPCSHCF